MADDFSNLIDKAGDALSEAEAKADTGKKTGPTKQRKLVIVVGFIVMLVVNLATLVWRQNIEAEELKNSAIDIIALVHEEVSVIYAIDGSLPQNLERSGFSAIANYQVVGDSRYEITPLLPAPYDVTVLLEAGEPLSLDSLPPPFN